MDTPERAKQHEWIQMESFVIHKEEEICGFKSTAETFVPYYMHTV